MDKIEKQSRETWEQYKDGLISYEEAMEQIKRMIKSAKHRNRCFRAEINKGEA